MNIIKFVYILMPGSIIMTLLWAPPAAILGDTSRIIYYHVPLAWISVLAFIISGIYSGVYLLTIKKQQIKDLHEKSHISASLGLFFTILTVITGSIWAKVSWGSFWNWDPRETSIMVLLLIYISYISLHTTLSNNENQGKICASYLIIAAATVPFFVFIIPRLYPSLHPDPILNREIRIHLDSRMRLTLLCSLLSFTFLFFYLFQLRIRMHNIGRAIEEQRDEKV